MTHKLSWNDTNRMPEEKLFWQGIDGSQVVAYFLTTQPYDTKSIGTTYCPNLKPTHVMGTWKRYGQQRIGGDLFLVYGHGDGGGGPTREMLHNIRRMERGIPGCPKVEHGAMRPFFERLIAEMKANPTRYPTWVGEFYLEFHRGTLTSVAKNKRFNRLAEIALRELELMAVLAQRASGHSYPHGQLRRLWDIVMLNQFHDILPGSSIGAVYEDSDRDYETFFAEAEALGSELAAAMQIGRAVLNAMGRSAAALLDPRAWSIPRRSCWFGPTVPRIMPSCLHLSRRCLWFHSMRRFRRYPSLRGWRFRSGGLPIVILRWSSTRPAASPGSSTVPAAECC